MGQTFRKLFDSIFGNGMRVVMLGLDAAGKTTNLYKLHIGEIFSTVPTIGIFIHLPSCLIKIAFIKRMQAAASDDLPIFEKVSESTETEVSVVDVNVSLEKAFTRDLSKETACVSYSASVEEQIVHGVEDKKVAGVAVPGADEAIQMGRMNDHHFS